MERGIVSAGWDSAGSLGVCPFVCDSVDYKPCRSSPENEKEG